MNQFCVDLNLNINPLKSDVCLIEDFARKPKGSPRKFARQLVLPLDIFNPEFLELVESVGLSVCGAEMFHTGPDLLSNIHTDDRGGDISKINFIYCDGWSEMAWYRPLVEQRLRFSGMGTPFMAFAPSEVELLHRQTVKFPSIVQVGIPHGIFNGNSDRFCLAVIPYSSKLCRRPTMEETINAFKEYH